MYFTITNFGLTGTFLDAVKKRKDKTKQNKNYPPFFMVTKTANAP